ncbi:MAG TPA: hypothetical protein VHU61_15610 [Solirubrobacteraceae bacterium]|jgi:hypothetical protein|nr:hypothetical protein [Solirubrobacteraceae bacterium]
MVTKGPLPERFRYRHYGLTIEVSQPLPKLAEVDVDPVDVRVEVVPPDVVAESDRRWIPVSPAVWRAEAADGSWLKVRYSYRDAWAEFVMDGRGDSVWVSRSSGVAISDLAELLLGPMFSCLASQRGLTCLHGAVVRVCDRVVVVAGPSGAGKSTTALGLVRWGDGLLISDDVAVLSERDGRVVTATGAPRIRMRSGPVIALLEDFDSLDPVWEDRHPEPKRYLPVENAAANRSDEFFPVDAIYFLAAWTNELAEPLIRKLPPAQALLMLMAQRHVLEAVANSAERRDLELLAQLIRTASVRELVRPEGLETTEQSVVTLISDVRTLP